MAVRTVATGRAGFPAGFREGAPRSGEGTGPPAPKEAPDPL